MLSLLQLSAALCPALHPVPPLRSGGLTAPRVSALRAQNSPLEDGYRELLPMGTADGNVDPELVERMDEEVRQLTGVSLDELLNPSKVVNLERDRILVTSQLEECTDAEQKSLLEQKLDKIETDLYREKRTVFRGWLKNVFVGQAAIAVLVSGVTVYDAIPGVSLDLSLRALAFWSYWLFTIPSLRARRPRGWEKKALNVAFLGSPILTFAMPFFTKDPPTIWAANLVLLIASYVYGYASGDDGEEVGGFTGALRWLDFGSGQERGVRADKREVLQQKQRERQEKALEKPLATSSSETAESE